MENTKENRRKFLAQYLGQTAISDGNVLNMIVQGLSKGERVNLDCGFIHFFGEHLVAELTPLSSITDEDKKHLGVEWAYSFDEYSAYGGNSSEYTWSREDIDYLRSNGYAIPFQDKSVKELISYGWIKLKS